jgi:hypothetical protein
MHPADFVRDRIQEGKTDEIVTLIHHFKTELDNARAKGPPKLYAFVNLFLTSVAGQLRQLSPDQNLHDDSLLAVWAELGYFGIERKHLPEDLEE